MTPEYITSRDNALLKRISRLYRTKKYRDETGIFVCEGEKLLKEALQSGVEPVAVLWEEQDARRESAQALLQELSCRAALTDAALFSAVSGLEHHEGVIFLCKKPQPRTVDAVQPGRYLVLDGVQDPGNMGTILRSADAFGVDGVWLLDGCADPYNPKVVRSAMGTLFRAKLYRSNVDTFFETMEHRHIPVYAAALSARARDIRDFSLQMCAVVVGNEGSGVTVPVLERCTGELIIPMQPHTESLNAAVAASIIMWEMSR